MIAASKSLPTEDAKAVVDILICMQPGCKADFLEVSLRGALGDCVRVWPEADWASVSAWLRTEGAGRIADWLDDAVRRNPRTVLETPAETATILCSGSETEINMDLLRDALRAKFGRTP